MQQALYLAKEMGKGMGRSQILQRALLSHKSLEFGIWSLVFGIWSLEFGIWSLEFGIWSLEIGIWSLEFGV